VSVDDDFDASTKMEKFDQYTFRFITAKTKPPLAPEIPRCDHSPGKDATSAAKSLIS
jgi:hypothetical protein